MFLACNQLRPLLRKLSTMIVSWLNRLCVACGTGLTLICIVAWFRGSLRARVSFGEETPELTAKGALPTPGALLQTRIVSEIWDNLEAWRQPLTDEVTALKNVHQAVWPIGPEELKKLEALAQVSVKPAKGMYTQKPISDPAKILVRLGLIEESEKWLVIKALYGLAEAPRRWSAHRDLLLRKISWEESGRKYFLVQCVADNNLWRIVSQKQGQSQILETTQADSGLSLHGLLGVYVDDMLITAETATQTRLVQELRAVWTTSEPEIAEVGRPIRFCGFNLHRLTGGGCLLNQEDYVQDLLQRFADIQGTSEVPCLREEEIEPEEPCPKQLKRAQMLTGAPQWITTRTRPDICFAVNKTAQLMSKFPAYATRYAENIIRYLRSTPGLGLVFKPLDEQCRFGKSEELTAPRAAGLLEVYADASFGPTSNKSQTGIVAVFCGAVVAWATPINDSSE